ncbi:hypothetical protein GGH12_005740 [Coemansia sp. RSA 1822]|nr:hypothetical protein LPJ76_005745 [Coemansia sp. RSA 638]KAJ2538906.1 hypothetical protein GGF49_005592 [Coemansia sp. RSA 1853]KAJ2558688.1 hypothetical protein GGH12_005740 [Coemansia sp. RSA 1822]
MDVVIVTGASTGIGRQVCIKLLERQPLYVVAVARSSDALQTLQQEAEAASAQVGHHGRLVPIAGDITNPLTRTSIITTASNLGQLRALINNAATVDPTGPLLASSSAQWHSIWETNFHAPISLISQCLHMLQTHKGPRVILNITSSTSQQPVPGFGPYGATKASLNYVTRALAVEYPDITSIAFYPGVVDTPMNARAVDVARECQEHAQRTGNHKVDMSHVIEKLKCPDSPDRVCSIMANLALNANPELSGKYITFSDPEMDAYSGEAS